MQLFYHKLMREYPFFAEDSGVTRFMTKPSWRFC